MVRPELCYQATHLALCLINHNVCNVHAMMEAYNYTGPQTSIDHCSGAGRSRDCEVSD